MQAEIFFITVTDTTLDKDYHYVFLSFDNAMKCWKEQNSVDTNIVSGIRPMTLLDFEEFFEDKEAPKEMFGTDNVIRIKKDNR